MSLGKRLSGAIVGGALALAVGAANGSAATITVAPSAPNNTSCIPFGATGGGEGDWKPNTGFVYRNVPAFSLKSGDSLAFDLATPNDFDIALDISLAATTVNGGDITQPFTTVVPNTELAASPRGDSVTGNFELSWTTTKPFSFPGGGLVIRFSNPSASYLLDTSCTPVLKNEGLSSDPTGFFVKRFFNDADGLGPYGTSDSERIGAFRVTTADATGQRAKALKKCKKKFKKSKKKTKAQKKKANKKFKKCKKGSNKLPA